MVKRLGLLGLVLGSALSSGCFLFREELPDASCDTDQDCFRAQGEVCNRDLGQCVVVDGPDAGTPTYAPQGAGATTEATIEANLEARP